MQDLKLGNVLLKTHRIDRRGYVAKVSDFGELTVCQQGLACRVGVCPPAIKGCRHVQKPLPSVPG